ncbi:MAG: hypothetical protein ABIG39_07505 [Candidatus Micrarchaeota archaeon]
MEKRVYEYESKEKGNIQKVIDTDPYADRSFSKQGYNIKEGKGVGGEGDKSYIYINAEPEFFQWAEEKFKEAEIQTFKRTSKKLEDKVIKAIEEEENAAESGFGAIFG